MNLVNFFVVGVLALSLASKVINAERVCPKNNYVIVDDKGIKATCLPCNNCPDGCGLEPRCGSTLTKSEVGLIGCKSCVPGKTYSDEHGTSSCKNCNICADKEIVFDKCTEERNTNCSKTCDKNYYYDHETHDCQPCSYCCGDKKDVGKKRKKKRRKKKKKDVVEKECVAHGMPKQQQCRYIHRALQCTPTSTATPLTTTTPLTTATPVPFTSNLITVAIIVAVILPTAVVSIVVAILLYRKCCRRTVDNEEEYAENANTAILRNHDQVIGLAMGQVPGTNACESCNTLSKFKVQIKLPPNCVEGESVRIACHLEDEQSNEILQGNYVYTWFKDDRMLENDSKILTLKTVKVSDFGRFKCQVECEDHAGDQSAMPANKEVFLDVKPAPQNTIGYTRLFSIPLDVHEDVVTELASAGTWKVVGLEYGLSYNQIRIIELTTDKLMQAQETLYAVQSRRPDLTVYDFCKFMKTKHQNQVVEYLKPYLTSLKESHRKSAYNLSYTTKDEEQSKVSREHLTSPKESPHRDEEQSKRCHVNTEESTDQ